MTHRADDDDYFDPREALKFEMGRAAGMQKKRDQSKRFASLIRASRVAEGLDALIRDALEAKPQ